LGKAISSCRNDVIPGIIVPVLARNRSRDFQLLVVDVTLHRLKQLVEHVGGCSDVVVIGYTNGRCTQGKGSSL
jgi:hypothetical protein